MLHHLLRCVQTDSILHTALALTNFDDFGLLLSLLHHWFLLATTRYEAFAQADSLLRHCFLNLSTFGFELYLRHTLAVRAADHHGVKSRSVRVPVLW